MPRDGNPGGYALATAAPAHLFVYGTLRRGSTLAPARLLAGRAAHLGTARVRGTLLRLAGHPGLVLGEADAGWVPGDVFALTADGAELLAALDAYEGCGATDPQPHAYERVTAVAKVDGLGPLDVWLYAWRGPVDPRRRIPEWPWPPQARR